MTSSNRLLGGFDGLCTESADPLRPSCYEIAETWVEENLPDGEAYIRATFLGAPEPSHFYASDWWTVAVDRWLEATS